MYGADLEGIEEAKERTISNEEGKILDDFHRAVFKVIKICKRVEPNNIDIDWLQNKLSFARNVDPLIIMDRAKDKIWHYRQQIIDRNIDFFMKDNFGNFIKNDKNKTFMYTLVNTIKKRVKDLSEEEKNHIWNLINEILGTVTRYKMVSGEYRS
jgi:hypothetical protein